MIEIKSLEEGLEKSMVVTSFTHLQAFVRDSVKMAKSRLLFAIDASPLHCRSAKRRVDAQEASFLLRRPGAGIALSRQNDKTCVLRMIFFAVLARFTVAFFKLFTYIFSIGPEPGAHPMTKNKLNTAAKQ